MMMKNEESTNLSIMFWMFGGGWVARWVLAAFAHLLQQFGKIRVIGFFLFWLLGVGVLEVLFDDQENCAYKLTDKFSEIYKNFFLWSQSI